MEGYGVRLQERLSDLLEASRQRPFLNFATAGDFGPLQYKLLYQHLASAFEHEALLVGFFPDNDFIDNDPAFVRALAEPDRGRYRPTWQLVPDRSTYTVNYAGADHRGRFVPGLEPDRSWPRRALRYSAAVLLVHHLWRQWWQRDHLDEQQLALSGYFETDPLRLRAVELILRDLAELARGRRRTLLVIPAFDELARARATGIGGSPPFLELMGRLAGQRWDIVNLMPRMLALPEDSVRALFLDCDGHWAAQGHRFAMAALNSAVP